MENLLLLNCLESVLGKSKKTSKGNYAFFCPNGCHPQKPKLEVQLQTNKKGENPFHCWKCEMKGLKLPNLFRKAKASRDKTTELHSILGTSTRQDIEQNTNIVELPKEYKHLMADNSLEARRAKVYLKKRGITETEIIKYGIGHATNGRYSNHVIIPSYDNDNRINYFIARSLDPKAFRKYDSPSCDKNKIIGFESLINWSLPIILVEGSFDAMAVRRNAIPLFGKRISNALMQKLVESSVKTIYIALDTDAQKDALKHAETLLNYGKEVYFITMDGKDPNELGFEEFTKLLHTACPLTFSDLMMKKLGL